MRISRIMMYKEKRGKNAMKYAYPAIFTFEKEEGCCYVNFPDINTICKSCYRQIENLK